MLAQSLITALLAAFAASSALPGTSSYGGTCTQCVSSPNNCDITAPCSAFVDKQYCACRPGYKAAAGANQRRIDTLPAHAHRVWVAPGVVCDTLCDDPWGTLPCQEVAVQDQCAPNVK